MTGLGLTNTKDDNFGEWNSEAYNISINHCFSSFLYITYALTLSFSAPIGCYKW